MQKERPRAWSRSVTKCWPVLLLAGAVAAALVGCGSSQDAGDARALGGAPGSGGQAAVGSAGLGTSSGGSSASAGSSPAGGSGTIATGGTGGSAGSVASGGTGGSAGSVASGGTGGSAGSVASGGTGGSAGSVASGGTGGSAGSVASGGTSGSAGSVASGGTSGSAGSVASGGTGGSAGSVASGGTGGSGAHCSPADATTEPYLTGLMATCTGDRFAYGVPNALSVFLNYFALPAPMVPNEPYAMSIEISGGGPFNIELWGTDAECGHANELLWWAPLDARTHCAEFTPTLAHTGVLYVHRQLAETDYLFVTGDAGMCQGGSCPAGANGEGRQPGTTLTAPLGDYQRTGGSPFTRGYDLEIGAYGRMVVVREGVQPVAGTPEPVRGGFFRMPPNDPYSDAWYCMGAGSTFTRLPDGAGYQYSFHNVTRLPSCTPGVGTASVSAADDRADITSTFAELSGVGLIVGAQECTSPYCAFRFHDTTTYQWLHVLTGGDVGSYSSPTNTPVPVAEATWFLQADAASPVLMTCASTGTITYDPSTTTSLSLENMGDYTSCPGEPIGNPTVSGALY